jgi:hypothetical protein
MASAGVAHSARARCGASAGSCWRTRSQSRRASLGSGRNAKAYLAASRPGCTPGRRPRARLPRCRRTPPGDRPTRRRAVAAAARTAALMWSRDRLRPVAGPGAAPRPPLWVREPRLPLFHRREAYGPVISVSAPISAASVLLPTPPIAWITRPASSSTTPPPSPTPNGTYTPTSLERATSPARSPAHRSSCSTALATPRRATASRSA